MEQECMSVFDPEQLPLVLGAQRADGLQDPATTTIIDAQGKLIFHANLVSQVKIVHTTNGF